MRAYLLRIALILTAIQLILTSLLAAQAFDCSLIFWEEIRDTVTVDKAPAALIRLSTLENTISTGFTTFLVIAETGDTIIDYSDQPQFKLPAVEGIGNPVEEYILNLKAPFTRIPEDLSKGRLITDFPPCEFNLQPVTGVVDPDTGKTILKIWPNPFRNELRINTGGTDKRLLEVYDILGKRIYMISIRGSAEYQIPVGTWSKGLYLIRIGDSVKKMVKN